MAGILSPPFIHPPHLEGYFQGWGVGVYKVWPRKKTMQESGANEKGEVFLLKVGAFLLTVKPLCLQSLKALARRTFSL